jgi:tyrosyl-tRNA synthetase
MLSPYAFYQTWIQAEDTKVVEYLRQFTFLDLEEIDAIAAESAEKPGLRIAQRRLAAEVTAMVHGPDEVRAAEQASAALFGRAELVDLPTSTLRAALSEAGLVSVPAGTTIVDALTAAGLVDSKSAARRAVKEGGAYVNNVRVEDPDETVDRYTLDGGLVVLRKGKKSVAGAEVERA